MKRIAVIGGGASGLMAAITAAQCGADVMIFERNDRVGKKILSTGNGKCNFSNRDFSVDYYNEAAKDKLKNCFSQFSVEDTVAFFQNAGMLIKEKSGYLYPQSEQASTVLDVLRLKAQELRIKTEVMTEIKQICRNAKNGMFTLKPAEGKGEFHSVIIAAGGFAAPKTGSDGSGARLAGTMGHHKVPVVPALVQLRCDGDFFKMIGGVRCEALLRLSTKEKTVQEEWGELQFTDYGISGIPVFQLSRAAAYLLLQNKKAKVSIDLFPSYGEEEYRELCVKRIRQAKGKNMDEFLLGMANKKLNLLFLKLAGLRPLDYAAEVGEKQLEELLFAYRRLEVKVTGTNSFEQAQISAGGIDINEVSDTLESVITPGVYLAGEVLDVDGRCGGYNLQWAWTSGYIAGKNAAQ